MKKGSIIEIKISLKKNWLIKRFFKLTTKFMNR